MTELMKNKTVLLTGATGYIGGRLLRVLEKDDLQLRCMARKPQFLRQKVAKDTEVVTGDLMNVWSLINAMKGVDTAYFLVHAMGSRKSFVKQERIGAKNFLKAAERAGVRKIIYLGGLGHGKLSEHLESRQEVGRILRSGKVQTVEFRAGVIIGSGSFSFEMMRALVDHLPLMIVPKWTRTATQPISVEDVMAYLRAALHKEFESSQVFEIGASDTITYEDLMREYADIRSMKRAMIPVPVLTPYLSSLWLGLVTPVYSRIGRKLIEGIRCETVVRDDSASTEFDISPRSTRDAIQRALVNEDEQFAATRWSDATSSLGSRSGFGGEKLGNRIVDVHRRKVSVPPAKAFKPIREIGGDNGYYFANFLWGIRGGINLLVGGAGIRRGRRDPEELTAGDALDFWRVEEYEPDKLLRLMAEMKLPGRGWLQFEVEGDDKGSVIHQTAIFDPSGIAGKAYWYGLYPIHAMIFSGMLRGIAKRAERDLDQK